MANKRHKLDDSLIPGYYLSFTSPSTKQTVSFIYILRLIVIRSKQTVRYESSIPGEAESFVGSQRSTIGQEMMRVSQFGTRFSIWGAKYPRLGETFHWLTEDNNRPGNDACIPVCHSGLFFGQSTPIAFPGLNTSNSPSGRFKNVIRHNISGQVG